MDIIDTFIIITTHFTRYVTNNKNPSVTKTLRDPETLGKDNDDDDGDGLMTEWGEMQKKIVKQTCLT